MTELHFEGSLDGQSINKVCIGYVLCSLARDFGLSVIKIWDWLWKMSLLNFYDSDEAGSCAPFLDAINQVWVITQGGFCS